MSPLGISEYSTNNYNDFNEEVVYFVYKGNPLFNYFYYQGFYAFWQKHESVSGCY